MYTLLSGKITTYKGQEYYINRDNEKGIYIYTWDKSVVDKSFIQVSDEDGTMYKKYVQPSEIGDIYKFDKNFEYMGAQVGVTRSSQNKYVLMTGDAEIAEKLCFTADQFDKYGEVWYHKTIEIGDKDLVYIGEDRRKISL